VFPFKTGHIITEKLDTITTIPKNYSPSPPPSKQKWHQKACSGNASVVKDKPWAEGLLNSIVAVDLFYKNNSLRQKNRICLIILDSTVEIAYKEYLVKEQSIGATKFKNICENRADVEIEVLKTLSINATTLKKINHYYKLRCGLIHQMATQSVDDQDIEDYRSIVEKLLHDMFGLNFCF
jgi:hypothetical protein